MTFLPHMRSDMLTGSGPALDPAVALGFPGRWPPQQRASVRHRRVTGRLPYPGGTWRHRSILLANLFPWRDVPRTPHAPFLSSPMCRPSAHSRPRSGSSFTGTAFVLFQTYSMMGIVSSVQQSMTACVTGIPPPRPPGLDESAQAPSRRVERRDRDMLARGIERPLEEEGQIFGDKAEVFLFLVFRRPPEVFQGSGKQAVEGPRMNGEAGR